jgi:amino acid adenylation domain-containing protein
MRSNTVDIQTEKIQGFRLSPQQKRSWLLQGGLENSPYQVKGHVIIEGVLDREKIKKSWYEVAKRHEILRTSFSCLDEMTLPLQVIDDHFEYIWQDLDLSHQKIEQQNNYIDNFFQSSKHKFSLSLVKIAEQKNILLIAFSTLYGDASSFKKIIREISCYYHNFDLELDDEPIQYADFSEWQNELLEGEETKIGRDYWQKHNDDSLLKLKLPLEKIVKQDDHFEPQVINLSVESDHFNKIINLITREETSTASFLFTCWQILIYRLTSQRDLVIGMSSDLEKYEELVSAIGLISKYIPIKNSLKDKITARELNQKNFKLQQEIEQWEEYFYWDDSSVFFPVVFEYNQDYSIKNTDHLSFSIDSLYSCIDQFKIKLTCQEKDNTLNLKFYYDANLFDRNDIQRLAEQFHTLANSIINCPDGRISNLEILSESEKQQIFLDFNQTKADFPSLQTIQQRFEQQVEKTPQAIALIDEQQQLTYQQLNQRANQLAHYLRKQAIVTEDLVAIYLEPSLESIVSLLGILKAGSAYVPLDPNLPSERLGWMLDDTKTKVILTQQQLVSNLPESTAKIICLDSQGKIIQQESEINLDPIAGAENLAYVIYTSGSTGKPKGVAIEHRQIINYLHSITKKLNFYSPASFAMVSTLAADLGNTMLFPALCTGGCLHLISYQCATDGEALGKYFQLHQIDYLKITPSHLTALLASFQPEFVLPRRALILGGEALNWSLIAKIRSFNADCSIFNHYGPTETTVGVLTYEIKEPSRDPIAQTIPLGYPLANTQVCILDKYLQPVPIGVAGELYVGGMQLSRGYLNRPELTHQKFVANQLQIEGSREDRYYKTGDQARYLPNGAIEFLGRIDRQVKIRGFRLELEEIEAALEQYSAIQQAVVIFQADNQRLIGYITAETNISPPNSAEIRDYLTTKLPEYAIPNTFICLKQFALNTNGKVDLNRLPTPETISSELSTTFVAPQTATEKAIADIWLEILRIERVGIHDDFFELGGHSLLATQVVSRIRRALQTELSLRQFFDAPTVADLSLIIAQNLAQQTDEEMLAQMLAELEESPEPILAEQEKNE